MKKRHTLKFKMWFLYFISIMFPILLLLSILVTYVNHLMIQNSQTAYSNVLNSIADNLDTNMAKLSDFSLLWLSNGTYTDFYEEANRSSYDFASRTLSFVQLLESYQISLQKIMITSFPDVAEVSFIPSNFPQTCYQVSKNKTMTVDQNFPSEAESWYASAVLGTGSPVFFYEEDNDRISLARLITDLDTREAIGVLKISSFSSFTSLLSGFQATDASNLFLFGDNRQILFCANEASSSLAAITQKLDFSSLSTQSVSITELEGYTFCTRRLKNSPWILSYLFSSQEFLMENRVLLIAFFFIFLVVLALSWFLFWFHSRRITHSVQSILLALKQIADGNLNVHISLNPGTNKEFLVIADQINRMTQNLDSLIQSEYKAKIAQKNAEYLALQSQINPHFLYNALNGIMTLNRIGETKKVEKGILHLTALFRYTCSRKQETSIKEECAFLENYLLLEKMRFDERLVFSIHLEQEMEHVSIPKLLLQPLVENAVVHGLSPLDRPMHLLIDVSSFFQESILFCCITISDDGIGFDVLAVKKEKSVGLENVRERLLCFSQDSNFEIQSLPEKGTTCRISFPFATKPS